jgi:hypothetical protein
MKSDTLLEKENPNRKKKYPEIKKSKTFLLPIG